MEQYYVQSLLKAVTIMVSLIAKNISIPPREARNLKKIYASMVAFEKLNPIRVSDSLKPLINTIHVCAEATTSITSDLRNSYQIKPETILAASRDPITRAKSSHTEIHA